MQYYALLDWEIGDIIDNEAVKYPTLVWYIGSDAASVGICFHLSFGMNKTVKKDRHIFDFKLLFRSAAQHNEFPTRSLPAVLTGERSLSLIENIKFKLNPHTWSTVTVILATHIILFSR